MRSTVRTNIIRGRSIQIDVVTSRPPNDTPFGIWPNLVELSGFNVQFHELTQGKFRKSSSVLEFSLVFGPNLLKLNRAYNVCEKSVIYI